MNKSSTPGPKEQEKRTFGWSSWRLFGFLAVFGFLCLAANAAQRVGASHYMYLSNNRIVTVELVDSRSVILNYINLSDSMEFVHGPNVAVIDAAGAAYRGHVIELDNPLSAAQRYMVGELVKPNEFKGYTILGSFDFQAPPKQVLVRVGSRILELEPLTDSEFEIAGSRIGELDLEMEDRTFMISFAGFGRGYGTLWKGGSPEAERYSRILTDLELLPPVLLERPFPKLPESERDLPDPVLVQLSAKVAMSGGIYDLKVKRGVNPRLDKLALEFVKNSWRMLPAISNGKLAASEATLNVLFER